MTGSNNSEILKKTSLLLGVTLIILTIGSAFLRFTDIFQMKNEVAAGVCSFESLSGFWNKLGSESNGTIIKVFSIVTASLCIVSIFFAFGHLFLKDVISNAFGVITAVLSVIDAATVVASLFIIGNFEEISGGIFKLTGYGIAFIVILVLSAITGTTSVVIPSVIDSRSIKITACNDSDITKNFSSAYSPAACNYSLSEREKNMYLYNVTHLNPMQLNEMMRRVSGDNNPRARFIYAICTDRLNYFKMGYRT